MQAGTAIAEILKREGISVLFGYPANRVIEDAACAGIRPVIVRQERTGIHMAEAVSRLSSGRRIGVFAMQHGPGAESSFGAIAQAYADSVPILVLAQGYPRHRAHVRPSFSAVLNMQHVTKSCEPVVVAADIPNVFRRAFAQLRSGRGGPVLVEIPIDVFHEDVGSLDYRPTFPVRSAPDPEAVRQAADALLRARRPVLYAGQGIHYAGAWPELRALAERLAAPVCTSVTGKSAFPENHPLALGTGGRTMPATVSRWIEKADVILGVGCSFTQTVFGLAIPEGRVIIHATLDPADVNKDVACGHVLLGDAKLTLQSLLIETGQIAHEQRDYSEVAGDIASVRRTWQTHWLPKLRSEAVPIDPYRVVGELCEAAPPADTIVVHDAGSPRDQLVPFWTAIPPLSYLGCGKSTQLGASLGMAMGAKIAHPDKLCVHVWGDAAIGFTGMDLETAVREKIPILSILLNNSCMAMELAVMPEAARRYGTAELSGEYAAMARSLGAYAERISEPSEIGPAIRRGIDQTWRGRPVLLEFITGRETALARPAR